MFQVNFISIAKQQSVHVPNLFDGIYPSTLLIGFISDKALANRIENSPFVFESYNLSAIQLYSNGQPIFQVRSHFLVTFMVHFI